MLGERTPAMTPSPVTSEGGAVQEPSLGELLSIANLLTLCRLCLVPLFIVLLLKGERVYALSLFGFAALTDALDGQAARWSGHRSVLGAFLDPFADKLLLLSAFTVLAIRQMMPGWVLAVVVIRDVTIVLGYLLLSLLGGERIPVRPSYLGKSSTFLQVACVFGALVEFGSGRTSSWYALLYVTVALTVISGIGYAYRGLVWLSQREPSLFI